MSAPQVGIDVASISRLTEIVKRNPAFAQRVFTPQEQRDCAAVPARWATRWAAKEAVRKLAGSAGWSPLPAFKEIEIVITPNGAPVISLEGKPAPFSLSLSHEGDTAMAVAMTTAGWELQQPLSAPLLAAIKLPPRPQDAFKNTFGTVVVIGGAPGFAGAPYMAAIGAMRGGAGLVRAIVPSEVFLAVAAKATEIMAFAADSVVQVKEHLAVADACVIGPGLGHSDSAAQMLFAVLEEVTCPTIVDADGLNFAAERQFDWHQVKAPLVLTPHVGEMARLTGLDAEVIQKDRVKAAQDYAEKSGAVLVLKGSQTVVASPFGEIYVNPHQVVALATGGTGDVFAGLIGSFLAQGLSTFDAACAAVFVHGEAGAIVQSQRGRAGAVATDVLDNLPIAQERVRFAIENIS